MIHPWQKFDSTRSCAFYWFIPNTSEPLERYPKSDVIRNRALVLPVMLFGGVWVWRDSELAEEASDAAEESHIGEIPVFHQV